MKAEHIGLQGKPVVISKNITAYDKQWWLVIATLLICDALAIYFGLTAAYTFRIQLLDYSAPAAFQAATYSLLIFISIPAFLLLFKFQNLYERENLLGGIVEYRNAARGVFDGIVLLMMSAFILRDAFPEVSRGWLIYSLIFTLACVLLARFLVRQVFNQLRKRGWLMARVLIVGANDQGVAMANLWQKAQHGMNVVGFVDDFKPIGNKVVGDIKVLGRPTALHQLANLHNAHEVVVVPSAVAWETYEEIIAASSLPKSYTLRLSTGFYETLANGVTVSNNTAASLLTINDARIVGADAMLKRILDLGLIALCAPVMLVLSAVITLGLKLSKKPILVRYQTIGERGKIFHMLKFNTANAAHYGSISRFEGSAPNLAQNIQMTFLDTLLYRTGMDKLPQLINVLRDEMSLVGTRPRVVGSANIDSRSMPNIQAVKPGVIGPWSISPESTTPTDEMRDDLSYVRKWTIWLDVQILVATVFSLFYVSKHARPALPKLPEVQGANIHSSTKNINIINAKRSTEQSSA